MIIDIFQLQAAQVAQVASQVSAQPNSTTASTLSSSPQKMSKSSTPQIVILTNPGSGLGGTSQAQILALATGQGSQTQHPIVLVNPPSQVVLPNQVNKSVFSLNYKLFRLDYIWCVYGQQQSYTGQKTKAL